MKNSKDLNLSKDINMATASRIEFKLIGPHDKEYQSGSTVTLSCHLSPETSAVAMKIRWFKETDCVCLYKNGQVTEGRSYEGRVSLFTEELQRGNVYLQMRDCRESDIGHYLCQVTSGDRRQERTVGVRCRGILSETAARRRSASDEDVFISRRERKWTEEERVKMEESALLTELKGQSCPDPVVKSVMSVMDEHKALWDTDSEDQLEKTEMLYSREIHQEIRVLQDRIMKERVEMRKREGKEIREKITDVVDSGRRTEQAEKLKWRIKQHQKEENEYQQKLKEERNKEKRKDLERSLQRECKQRETAEQELKRLQEERRVMVKNLRLEMESREKSSAEADKHLISTILPEFQHHIQTLMTQKQKEVDSRMVEKDRELESVKLKVSHLRETHSQMEKDHKQQLEDINKSLEEKDKQLLEKDTALTEQTQTIEKHIKTMEKEKDALKEKERLLQNTEKQMETSKKLLETLGKELQEKRNQLQETMILLEQQKTELAEKDKKLEERDRLLEEKDKQVEERDRLLEEKDKQVEERDRLLEERTDPHSPVPVGSRCSKEGVHAEMGGQTSRSIAPLKNSHSIEGLPPKMSGESSSPDSPVLVPVPELRLVLLGRTGCGKSEAGNTILGREERSQAGTSPVTQQSESRQGEVAGRKVTVVDTPDWFCPQLSPEELRQDVGLCVRLSAPGPHAFLLVIPVKQPAGEERGMLEKMEEMFGERCWRNIMILFTVTEEEQNPEQFIQSGSQEVQTLVEKCGNRFHCLNIKESGEGSQVSELLEKIEKMVEGNRERFYSSEIYLETESLIREIEEVIVNEREKMKEREQQEIRKKLKRSIEDVLMKFTQLSADFHVQIRKQEERITELERMVKVEKDDSRKKELERELERETQKRKEIQLELDRLREESEKEKREMEERHRQEMEEIRETYEGDTRMEAERNFMKIILPELQKKMLTVMAQKQKDFDCRMEEKERELETLRHRLREGIRDAVSKGQELIKMTLEGYLAGSVNQFYCDSKPL